MDKNTINPYTTTENIVFTGIYNNSYIDTLRYLANKGLNVYLGGIYYDGKICRGISTEEINCENIHLITVNGLFNFGTIYNYIRYADVALGLYPADFEGGLSSKITEYLALGCPVISENTLPNSYRIIQCNGGCITDYNNPEKLYTNIKFELNKNRDRKNIMDRARLIFNPETICKNILTLN